MALPISPLLTRGMGPQPGLITRGFRLAAEVIRKIYRRLRGNSSRLSDLIDKIPDIYRVRAMLLSINSKEIPDPRSKLLISEVHDREKSKVIISDMSTTSVKSAPYRIVISDIKVKKGG